MRPATRIRSLLFLCGLSLVLPLASGCALLVGGAVAGTAAGTAASVEASKQEDHSGLTYTKTVLMNVVYVPAKVVFAAAGAITSGVTYVVTLGNEQPAGSIWTTSVGGDYVMTPRMIEGSESARFLGPDRAAYQDRAERERGEKVARSNRKAGTP